MRRIRAKGVIGIGLALALVAGAIGGWALFRSSDDSEEPIVVGTTSTPTMVDPAGAYDASAWALMSNLYQSLLTFEHGREQPVPDAAESCGFTDNELTVYRCTLRSDLKFSNGRPITAEDVQFSYERIQAMAARAEEDAADDSIPEDEKFSYAGPSALLANLLAVRVDGRDVIFELEHSDATFPFVVAGSVGAIVDREKYAKLELRDNWLVDGSGPFMLEEYHEGESVELVPNPEYRGAHEPAEQPVTVRYFYGNDEESPEDQLVAAWEAGELDVNDGKMPPGVMANVNRSDPEHPVTENTAGSIRVLAFNTDEGMPVDSQVARQTAAALLDRESLSSRVQQGTVEPLYSLIPVGYTGHGTPYFDQYRETDTEVLRQRMLDAGLSLPVEFEIAYSRGAANHEEAAAIERQLEEGDLFEVEVAHYEWDEFIPGVYSARDYDAYLIGWRPDFPDPSTFTDGILGPGDGMATGYSDERIDGLIAEAQAEQDRAQTADTFLAIHELAAESAAIIPIWQEKRFTISQDDITGVQHLIGSGIWRLWELRRI
ncbi:peptide/nickel transport system substrate-binding protein [Streptomyces zhaozhouensis]|uniref:Peptide/nickel transport system substrate-binding protein n=1 Tax=Streptomyces zhaozhouensis TaxID=1300267 RepID=A0A286DTI0_9ACTN|nr:ABC transporter substrate-binding protein [Streptomyces zhaozhouensis]SOD61997.1 peptide/nickel transport system substrate-binding protein [Streptomyces zhaozhouensis]